MLLHYDPVFMSSIKLQVNVRFCFMIYKICFPLLFYSFIVRHYIISITMTPNPLR